MLAQSGRRSGVSEMALWQRFQLAGLGTIFLASWAVMIASGCSFLLQQGPSDLRFVKLDLTYLDGSKFGPRVLVATLATHRDLEIDVHETGAYPHIRARTCSPGVPPVELYAGLPYLGDLDPYEYPLKDQKAEDAARTTPTEQLYIYHVWFSYKNDDPRYDMGIYDFAKDPEDVCLRIVGSPSLGVGVGILTNEIRIPKAAIAAA